MNVFFWLLFIAVSISVSTIDIKYLLFHLCERIKCFKWSIIYDDQQVIFCSWRSFFCVALLMPTFQPFSHLTLLLAAIEWVFRIDDAAGHSSNQLIRFIGSMYVHYNIANITKNADSSFCIDKNVHERPLSLHWILNVGKWPIHELTKKNINDPKKAIDVKIYAISV